MKHLSKGGDAVTVATAFGVVLYCQVSKLWSLLEDKKKKDNKRGLEDMYVRECW